MTVRTRLVLALLTGPLAAAVDMTILYVLAARAQATASELSLHVASAVAFAVALVGAAYAFREKRTMHGDSDRSDRFLALLAIVLGAFFALLIAAFEVPSVVLRPSD